MKAQLCIHKSIGQGRSGILDSCHCAIDDVHECGLGVLHGHVGRVVGYDLFGLVKTLKEH